jgi:hypothetical protein
VLQWKLSLEVLSFSVALNGFSRIERALPEIDSSSTWSLCVWECVRLLPVLQVEQDWLPVAPSDPAAGSKGFVLGLLLR